MYIIFSVAGRVSLCLDVVLSRFSFSFSPLLSFCFLLFLSRFFLLLRRRIEFQYHFLFIILFSFLLSFYICLCLIITIRQPSPNKCIYKARRVLFFSRSCYWFSITNFSLSPHARSSSPPLPTLGSEQKRLIKVRINTSLSLAFCVSRVFFWSFSRSRSLSLYFSFTQRHPSCRRTEWIIRMVTIGGTKQRLVQPMRKSSMNAKKSNMYW